MLKTVFFTIIAFTIALNSFPQEKTIKNKLDIHTMPLTMIDLTPRLRLGAEYTTNSKIAYCLEIGIGNHVLNKNRLKPMLHRKEYRFFEVRPEIKYYFHSSKTLSANYYFAAEAFFLKMNSLFENTYYHLASSHLICYFESADFEKIKYGLHIKAGCKHLLFNRISVDCYIGIGAASRTNSFFNITNPNTGEYYEFEEWFPQPERYEGNSVIAHLTAGCKFGWMFSLPSKKQ